MRWTAAGVVASLGLGVSLGVTGLHAFQSTLTADTVQEAVALGQTGFEGDRTRFHRPYRVVVGIPPLDAVEIVTPFRRVVIAAELLARAGSRRFGQREALNVLEAQAGRVSVHADLTFHPQNALVLVPAYTLVWVNNRGRTVEPATVESQPRYIPKTGIALPEPFGNPERLIQQGRLGPSLPMLGATIVATFSGVELGRADSAGWELVVGEAGQPMLARLPIDLTKLR